MTVYKVMELNYSNYTGKYHLKSYFWDYYFYRLNEVNYTTNFQFQPGFSSSTEGKSVDIGFHACVNYKDAVALLKAYVQDHRNYPQNVVIVACQIPEGAYYYEGEGEYVGHNCFVPMHPEVCSDRIIVKAWKHLASQDDDETWGWIDNLE